MSNWALVLPLLAGIALGVFFYGGLFLTARRLMDARHPALIALASFWIRSLAVLAAAVFFARRRWQSGVVLLAGFAVGRLVTAVLTREKGAEPKCT